VPGGISASTPAALVERFLPLLILGRVEDVDVAGDHADGARRERAVVRSAVDPACEAGEDDEIVLAKIVGQAAREAAGCG
jgi:hypothetical protein